jgi:hypothetical protein
MEVCEPWLLKPGLKTLYFVQFGLGTTFTYDAAHTVTRNAPGMPASEVAPVPAA